MKINIDIGKALSHTMDNQGKENAQLNQRIAKLEAEINPRPFFDKPLMIFWPMEDSPIHSRKFKKIAPLLASIHAFVMKNIKGRVDISYESFEALDYVIT